MSKPYYKVYVKNRSWFTSCDTKLEAIIRRKQMQDQGYTTVYINKKKGPSRISDYHQGGY